MGAGHPWFETARPFGANTANPPKNAGSVPGNNFVHREQSCVPAHRSHRAPIGSIARACAPLHRAAGA